MSAEKALTSVEEAKRIIELGHGRFTSLALLMQGAKNLEPLLSQEEWTKVATANSVSIVIFTQSYQPS